MLCIFFSIVIVRMTRIRMGEMLLFEIMARLYVGRENAYYIGYVVINLPGSFHSLCS